MQQEKSVEVENCMTLNGKRGRKGREVVEVETSQFSGVRGGGRGWDEWRLMFMMASLYL